MRSVRASKPLAHAMEELLHMQIDFTESDALLVNPGMGWQTFGRFADGDPALAGLPSSVAYFRHYWSDLEPAEGAYNFGLVDELLARARAAGQRLAFRVMCAGGPGRGGCPDWMEARRLPGFEYTYGRPDLWPATATPPDKVEVPFTLADPDTPPVRRWMADLDDPAVLDRHLALIHALGERCDGHPDLDLLDVGSIGLWGEWHLSGTGYDLPHPDTCERIRQAYRDAFPNTKLACLIGDTAGLSDAVSQHVGWRADCLGDMGGFSATWNHMDHFYRQQLARTHAEEAWKAAPVAWESCWDVRKWHAEGWDIRAIFDYALDLHGSYLNNKSAPVPPETRPEIERFLKRLGYRLLPKRIEHSDTATAGDVLPVRMTWRNAGVAPPYDDYLIACRLCSVEGGEPTVLTTGTSVRLWLPGEHDAAEPLALPAGLAPGRYDLDVGLVDPRTDRAAISLAIDAPRDDGWHRLSRLTVA